MKTCVKKSEQVNHTLFLTIDTTLQPHNFLRFRKNLLNAL